MGANLAYFFQHIVRRQILRVKCRDEALWALRTFKGFKPSSGRSSHDSHNGELLTPGHLEGRRLQHHSLLLYRGGICRRDTPALQDLDARRRAHVTRDAH